MSREQPHTLNAFLQVRKKNIETVKSGECDRLGENGQIRAWAETFRKGK